MGRKVTLKTPEAVREFARRFYSDELAAGRGVGSDGKEIPFSPDRATSAVAALGYSKSAAIGIVAAVYYVENGYRFPLVVGGRKRKDGTNSPADIAKAVRKRRDGRGRLGRWEVIAESLAAYYGIPKDGTGKPSPANVVALFEKAGGVKDVSYTGRGTRAGAKGTRTDAAAEVAGS